MNDSAARKTIVIGAGIAGLLAADLLRSRGGETLVVDQSPVTGGLLRSEIGQSGETYDLGTHFAVGTGVDDIDGRLFDGLDGVDFWRFTESLDEGHFWNGRLNTETGCIDTTLLADDVREKAVAETLDRKAPVHGYDNLEERILATFGPTLAETVFRPVMKKLTGAALADLADVALDQFNLPRIVLTDREQAKALKQTPEYDAKIAFANRADGASSILKLYPKSGGVGAWPAALEKKLREHGVDFLLGAAISGIQRQDDRLRIAFKDGSAVDCDRIVWTVAAEPLLFAMGMKPDGAPPYSRDLCLYHFLSDRPLLTTLHWVCNYDPAFTTYRVTQYPNIRTDGAEPLPHRLSVEIPLDQDVQNPDPEAIAEELKTMGLVDPGAVLTLDGSTRRNRAFPVIGGEVYKRALGNLDRAAALDPEIHITGRAKGIFHQRAILRDVHTVVTQLS